ncbi:MAG: DM13 domain-containing protein [Acidimicrobiales bacterium]
MTVLAAGCARPARPTLGPAEVPTTLAIAIPDSTDGAEGISTERAAPRWETVATLSGDAGGQTASVTIADGAIQWRVNWQCEAGFLRILTTPPPKKPGPLVSGSCPTKGEAFSILTGPVMLAVEAGANWSATVEQQVETPLNEPALAEMTDAAVAAEGTFYDIERTGGGTARIYTLGDGRRFLRLDDFTVSANTDLFVWLSEAPRPPTSAEAVAAPKVVLGDLKSTVGSHNYEIPADLAAERIKSIVIWCQPVAIAYTAAALAAP